MTGEENTFQSRKKGELDSYILASCEKHVRRILQAEIGNLGKAVQTSIRLSVKNRNILNRILNVKKSKIYKGVRL